MDWLIPVERIGLDGNCHKLLVQKLMPRQTTADPHEGGPWAIPYQGLWWPSLSNGKGAYKGCWVTCHTKGMVGERAHRQAKAGWWLPWRCWVGAPATQGGGSIKRKALRTVEHMGYRGKETCAAEGPLSGRCDACSGKEACVRRLKWKTKPKTWIKYAIEKNVLFPDCVFLSVFFWDNFFCFWWPSDRIFLGFIYVLPPWIRQLTRLVGPLTTGKHGARETLVEPGNFTYPRTTSRGIMRAECKEETKHMMKISNEILTHPPRM